MDPSPGTVDLTSLAPPLRALVAGQQAALETLRAEVASLTDRNRRLEQQGPEALVEDLHAKVVSLNSVVRGRPIFLRGGMNGAINAHSRSVRVACIATATALILRASDFGPHVVPPRLL